MDCNACKLVHDWLCDYKNGPWLMFVDDIHWDVLFPSNEDDQTGGEPLKSFLPEHGQGSIIFTSRDRRVATNLASTNAIYSMMIPGKDEAFQLLQKKLGNNINEDKAAMLALIDALAYSPLAICQAAANMTRQSPRTSVSTYLSEFTSTVDSLDPELNDPYSSVENPVKITSQITPRQNRLKRNPDTNALPFMSFFDPEDIPMSIFQSDVLSVPEKTGSTQLCPDILREYLVSSKTSESEMFKAYPHLLVYAQKWLLSSSETQCWVRGLLVAAAESHDYLSTITSKLETLEGDEPPTSSDFLTWSKLQNNLAIFQVLMGNHSRASWIAERVVGADVRKLGSDHTETLRSMDNFAFVLRRQGRLQQAEEYNRRALELTEEQFGPESPDVSQSISPVAWALQDQGKWEEAEALHWQLLRSQIRLFDNDHPYITASLNNIILDLRQEKKHEEAYAITKIFFHNEVNVEFIDSASEERIGYERMRNNFRKLLKHYAKDLKVEATTDQHQNLVGFVSAHSVHITREFFSMSPLVNKNRVFAKLTNSNSSSNLSKDRRRKVEDYLASVDKDKSTDREVDTDDSSDEDCMDAEADEYARYDGTLENLDLMENFVLESAAYQALHRRLHDFVHPSLWSRLRDLLTSWSDPSHEHHAYVTQYKLHNLAAELRYVEPRAIHISRNERSHLFSYQGVGILQNVVERWSGERWDWWPLPSCPRRLQGCEALVQWKCVGLSQY
ncbi:hypothetical protein ACHAQK_003614 [Fusarium lateritium]